MREMSIEEKWAQLSPRGRDAWIAERVFKWVALSHELGRPPGCTKATLTPIPRFSTSIEAAWLVVEKMREDRESVFELSRAVGTGYLCNFVLGRLKEWRDSAPDAICFAALKALENQR